MPKDPLLKGDCAEASSCFGNLASLLRYHRLQISLLVLVRNPLGAAAHAASVLGAHVAMEERELLQMPWLPWDVLPPASVTAGRSSCTV